ncbi:PepSY-associated TM helix domain-containing protein [Pseudoalteromonas sp. G4]|uniref:PepSY-associated TM helix domain-containing protein n=1 Tax=Pseudoalteromonas sp. G4 TaxID=2992761 RepID=UPI00237DF495|nr:PepSY-associated TM helix domain-containing protein [Pseudoalteromonas sp. G4]MDE3272842.1 PepSY domain-containing protein [Pseudoalteromonas sp. G4]
MKSGFRQSMAWLHTWTGILVSWLLYFIFVTGTLGYFDSEIDAWMAPELPQNTASVSASLNTANTHLNTYGRDAKEWRIYLPLVRSEPHLWLRYQQKNADGKLKNISKTLNGENGEELTHRKTGGGQALYRMHYRLHYLPKQFAYYLVGVFTVFMLLGLVTGIVVHKKIFKEFFTFRRNKGASSWLDGHNLMSVVSLPFHLMITYSGLIMFMFTYVPFVMNASYGFGEENKQHFFDDYYQRGAPNSPSGIAANQLPLNTLYQKAEAVLENHNDSRRAIAIRVFHPHDLNSLAVFSLEQQSPSDDGAKLILHATTGELYSYIPVYQGTRHVHSIFLELHEGMFATLPVRWLYFFAGLTGCVMIASGMVLWTTKRRKKALANPDGLPFSFKLTEGLNIGTVVGLPAAIAVYFLANRLIAVDFAHRAEWEMHSFFITWCCFIGYGCWYSARKLAAVAWYRLWLSAGFLFALVPIVNALTTHRGLINSIKHNDVVFAAFDFINLVAAISCFAIALLVKKHRLSPIAHKLQHTRQKEAAV